MRTLKEFLESRMAEPKVGFRGPTVFAAQIGIKLPTYLRLVRDPKASSVSTREMVARALKFIEWADLMKAYAADDVTWGLLSVAGMPLRMPPVPDTMPDGIDPRPITLNPIWEINVAAANWSVVPIAELNPDDPRHRAILEDGRFELNIVGDCMEPAYPSGSVVRFRLMRSHLEAMPVSEAYVLCRDDGTATFKVLVETVGDEYVLAALNQKKYPKMLRVRCDEIVRIAKAVGVVTAAPRIKLKVKR
jgi:hypothetical protein